MTTSLSLVPLGIPNHFHPRWRHDITMSVEAADATGESDCFMCDEVDLFTQLDWGRNDGVGQGLVTGDSTGDTCGNNQSVVRGIQCMDDWLRVDQHLGGNGAASFNGFQSRLFDADEAPNGDDLLPTTNVGDTFGHGLNWMQYDFFTYGASGNTAATIIDRRVVLFDSPQQDQSRPGRPNQSLMMQWKERGPGEQGALSP